MIWMKPQVSVVMPVFNCERFVAEAVESILNQTFTDFEFLIIDDGSTDRTLKILKNFSDPRLRVIRHSKNLGIVAALNRGIAEAKGEFIARQDADDRSLPDRLALQVKHLHLNREIGVLGSSVLTIDKIGKNSGAWCMPQTDKEIRLRMLYISPFVHGSVMMRAELVKKVGGYQEDYPCAEDHHLWVQLAKITQFANLPERLYEFRLYSESISRRQFSRQKKSMEALRQIVWQNEAYLFYQFSLRAVARLWLGYRPWAGYCQKKILPARETFRRLCYLFFQWGKTAELRQAVSCKLLLDPLSWRSWFCLFLLIETKLPVKYQRLEAYLKRRVY